MLIPLRHLRRGAAADRQPFQPEREHQDRDHAEEELRNGLPDNADRRQNDIRKLPFVQGGDDPQEAPEDRRKDKTGQRQFHSDRKSCQDDVLDGHSA